MKQKHCFVFVLVNMCEPLKALLSQFYISWIALILHSSIYCCQLFSSF